MPLKESPIRPILRLIAKAVCEDNLPMETQILFFLDDKKVDPIDVSLKGSQQKFSRSPQRSTEGYKVISMLSKREWISFLRKMPAETLNIGGVKSI